MFVLAIISSTKMQEGCLYDANAQFLRFGFFWIFATANNRQTGFEVDQFERKQPARPSVRFFDTKKLVNGTGSLASQFPILKSDNTAVSSHLSNVNYVCLFYVFYVSQCNICALELISSQRGRIESWSEA